MWRIGGFRRDVATFMVGIAFCVAWSSVARAEYTVGSGTYVQFRTYGDVDLNPNRYRAVVGFLNDGAPIEEWEITGVKLIGPAGEEAPVSGTAVFSRQDYLSAIDYDADGDGVFEFTSGVPTTETGFLFDLGDDTPLQVGTYYFKATSPSLTSGKLYYPENKALTPVSSEGMNFWWDNGSLWLSWDPPNLVDAFIYRVHLYGPGGKLIFFGTPRAASGGAVGRQTVQLGTQLLQKIHALAAGSDVSWRIDTRASIRPSPEYLNNNYARSYSKPVTITDWPTFDYLAGAKVIDALSYTDSADVTGVTSYDWTDPYYCYWPAYSVWYALTPDALLEVTAQASGAMYPAPINVFQGTQPNGLVGVACGYDRVSFVASPGTTYYFQVAAGYNEQPTHLDFSATSVPLEPVPNDELIGASQIESLPYRETVEVRGATANPSDPLDCYGTWGVGMPGSVWYKLTPDRKLLVAAQAQDLSYSLPIGVYQDTPGGPVGVTCGYEGVWFTANPAETYYLAVATAYNQTPNQLTFSVKGSEPPPNDEIEGATPVSNTLPYEDVANVEGSTYNPSDPVYCYWPDGSVWYRFTPDTEVRVIASARFETYDYAVPTTVFRGVPGSLEYVACGWDYVSFTAYPGETYYFLVTAFPWMASTPLTFRVTQALTLGLVLDPKATFDPATGAATVRGTLSCNTPVQWVSILGNASQRVGRFTLRGEFSTTADCDGETPWQATFVSPSGTFAGGHADVWVQAGATDPQTWEWASTQANGTVQLKGESGKKETGKPPK